MCSKSNMYSTRILRRQHTALCSSSLVEAIREEKTDIRDGVAKENRTISSFYVQEVARETLWAKGIPGLSRAHIPRSLVGAFTVP